MGAIKFGCVSSETHLGGSWCSDKCDLYNDIWGVCTEDWDLQRGYNCPIFGYPAGVYTFDLAIKRCCVCGFIECSAEEALK